MLVVGGHPLGQQRPAATDDAADAVLQQRQMLPEQPGVNREKVHALPGLLFDDLQDRVVIDILNGTIDNDLINRHRPERHWADRQQLASDVVQIAAGTQVHHRIGPGLQRDLHLFDLAVEGRADAAASDVGVDLA